MWLDSVQLIPTHDRQGWGERGGGGGGPGEEGGGGVRMIFGVNKVLQPGGAVLEWRSVHTVWSVNMSRCSTASSATRDA